MDKITLKALELSGFKNPEALAQILFYTPNPRVATEMLLGVYQPMSLTDFGQAWKSKYSSEEFFIWVTEINELANTVTYSRFDYKTQTVYYMTKDDYNARNSMFVLERPKEFYSTRQLRTTGYVQEPKTMSMEDFMEKFSKHTNLYAWEEWENEANSYINPDLPMPNLEGFPKLAEETTF